jgi:IstB-like ATP binding protein
LSFLGGVPQLIVPDNPRALVKTANRYEPELNDSVLDFARHYGCSVLPARAYHPQDKAKVELGVQLVERWILARLRKHSFATVHEVNDAVAPLLEHLNQRATIITSQLPIEHWHEWIGDATVADAMLDRLMQNHHRLTLTGESLRKGGQTKAKTALRAAANTASKETATSSNDTTEQDQA